MTMRVSDPTLVTASLTVKDMGNIKELVETLQAGAPITMELEAFWSDFLSRYEEASKRQLWIYRFQNPEPTDG